MDGDSSIEGYKAGLQKFVDQYVLSLFLLETDFIFLSVRVTQHLTEINPVEFWLK